MNTPFVTNAASSVNDPRGSMTKGSCIDQGSNGLIRPIISRAPSFEGGAPAAPELL
jgi:hypothetical protein